MIKISAATEATLVKRISDALGLVKVECDGTVIEPVERSTASLASIRSDLPDDDFIQFDRYVGFYGFRDFIYAELSRELNKGVIPPAYAAVDLTSLSGYEDTNQTSKRFVQLAKSLPWTYRLTLGLPNTFSNVLSKHIGCLTLSKALSLRRGDHLPQPFPVTSNDNWNNIVVFDDITARGDVEKTICSERIYFTETMVGWSGLHGGFARMVQNFEDNLRVFYGTCLALGFLPGVSEAQSCNLLIMIHKEGDGRDIVRTTDCSAELARFGHYPLQNTNRHGLFETETLKYLGLISGCFKPDNFSERLFVASKWYYKASGEPDQVDRLLYLAIALEVLLSDRTTADTGSVSGLLGSRCAWMIADNVNERETILKTFKSIYRLRSKIVHEGRHQLEYEERSIVRQADVLVRRVINHEVRMLNVDT